jgi:hypothetical protein
MGNDERPEVWDDLQYYEKNPSTVFSFKMPPECKVADFLTAAGKMAEVVEKLYSDFDLSSEVNYGKVEITRAWTAEEKKDKLLDAQKAWDRAHPTPAATLSAIPEG